MIKQLKKAKTRAGDVKRKYKRAKKYKQYVQENLVEHVKYDYSYNRDTKQITLAIDDKRIENPILTCDHGQINATITGSKGKFNFTFGIEDLPLIDGIITKLYVVDGDNQLMFSSFNMKKKENYTMYYDIMYTDDYVYYFRNTASKAGRLVLQKKVRAHFENEEYQARVEKIYAECNGELNETALFYEKFGAKFEESASKIFPLLADLPNVYFVLDKNSPQYPELKAKYGDKIVSPDEDKFIYLVFTSKYYIGTEVPFHMVTLRTPYKEYRKEILMTNKHRFIFLQHGVMYALSLKPSSRNSFKKKGIHAPYKIVVSSELEKNHFKELGHCEDVDLWKTGLATFDNKQIDRNADKVTVMLTWRPWDEQKETFEETTYYNAVKSIVDTIEDKSKLQLILHPKVLETINPDNDLLQYKFDGLINDGLNQTKVLISDYSSVTFDAFYRGINVIFWWNQKDMCLEQYKNDLCLTEDNVFGDIITTNDNLNQVIEDNYNRPQSQQYIDKYRKIVEFHDNNNTDRIVEQIFTESLFDEQLPIDKLQLIGNAIETIEPYRGNYGRLKMAYLNRISEHRATTIAKDIDNQLIVDLIEEVLATPDTSEKDAIIEKYLPQLEQLATEIINNQQNTEK